MPSVSIAPPTKAQTTTAITLKANCSVILNPFLIKFTLLTPLGYNQITKRNPKGAKTMNDLLLKQTELLEKLLLEQEIANDLKILDIALKYNVDADAIFKSMYDDEDRLETLVYLDDLAYEIRNKTK